MEDWSFSGFRFQGREGTGNPVTSRADGEHGHTFTISQSLCP